MKNLFTILYITIYSGAVFADEISKSVEGVYDIKITCVSDTGKDCEYLHGKRAQLSLLQIGSEAKLTINERVAGIAIYLFDISSNDQSESKFTGIGDPRMEQYAEVKFSLFNGIIQGEIEDYSFEGRILFSGEQAFSVASLAGDTQPAETLAPEQLEGTYLGGDKEKSPRMVIRMTPQGDLILSYRVYHSLILSFEKVSWDAEKGLLQAYEAFEEGYVKWFLYLQEDGLGDIQWKGRAVSTINGRNYGLFFKE